MGPKWLHALSDGHDPGIILPSPAVLSLLPPDSQAPKMLCYQPQAAAERCPTLAGVPHPSLPSVLVALGPHPGLLECCASTHDVSACKSSVTDRFYDKKRTLGMGLNVGKIFIAEHFWLKGI